MLDPGMICRSKDTILKCEDEEKGRLCRILEMVPEERWRTPGLPEYKVELVALPVRAFRRESQLVPLHAPEPGLPAFALAVAEAR